MDKVSLNFKYKFPENYNPLYINGAHGGIGPQGEMVINFYMERQPLPYEEKVKLEEDGTLSGDVQIEPKEHSLNIIRYVQSGVILNLDTARRIHEWLGNHIRSMEQIKNENQSGDVG